jgi:hypothetical protein
MAPKSFFLVYIFINKNTGFPKSLLSSTVSMMAKFAGNHSTLKIQTANFSETLANQSTTTTTWHHCSKMEMYVSKYVIHMPLCVT